MKALVIVSALMFSVFASAGEYSGFSMTSKGYAVYQMINFQSASTFVRANEVCQKNGNLYSTKSATVSVDYCNDHGSNCKTVTKALVQPMNATAQRCAKFSNDECVAWETYALNQGPKAKISFYSDAKSYEDGDAAVSTASFTLPVCGTAAPVPAN